MTPLLLLLGLLPGMLQQMSSDRKCFDPLCIFMTIIDSTTWVHLLIQFTPSNSVYPILPNKQKMDESEKVAKCKSGTSDKLGSIYVGLLWCI